ncbi:hypothetical protein HI914_07149 [Erysiphe necator]|nr:hypothetical protein HI914_07149 [Erysiphe necator]
MHFYTSESLFILLLLFLSSSLTIKAAPPNNQGLIIESVDCRHRIYPTEKVYNAVIDGLVALVEARALGLDSTDAVNISKRRDQFFPDVPLYEFVFWNSGPNIYQADEKDVVVFTGNGKLMNVFSYYRTPNKWNMRLAAWEIEYCSLKKR